MGPVEELWQEFEHFSPNHTTGLSKRVGWNFRVPDDSHRFIKSPEDESKIQVNSGASLKFYELYLCRRLKRSLFDICCY